MQQADRRRAPRFEFVGDQWGSLVGHDTLRLRDFGREGALVESTTPLPVGSVQAIRLVHQGGSAQCRVAVRHVSTRSGGSERMRYLIGLEFLNLDDQASAFVDQMLTQRPDSPLSNEA